MSASASHHDRAVERRAAARRWAEERLRRDRWRWRQQIRQRPSQLAFYRALVALVGLFLVGLGLVSGPLPGPGGIPLVLLGLAVWGSEFHWAHRLMVWFKTRLAQYRTWSRDQRVAFWVVFLAGCGAVGWGYLVVVGPPGWLPAVVAQALSWLPGV